MRHWRVSTTALAIVHTIVEAETKEEALARAAQVRGSEWDVVPEVFGDVDLGDEDEVSVSPVGAEEP